MAETKDGASRGRFSPQPSALTEGEGAESPSGERRGRGRGRGLAGGEGMLGEERWAAAAALILELNQEDLFALLIAIFFTSSQTILVENNFPSSDILI